MRVRLRQMLNPKRDAPFPLWMIYPVLFAALYLTHFSLLRLPYYWDEAGYYIPAAWDFFRTGSLIPTSTLTNAHPPLPSVYLALWWKLSGFTPEVTRTAVLLVAALGLLSVWRLAMRLHGNGLVAFATVALTGLYPIWFAQSTLAHADIFAVACTLWGLVYSLPDRALPDEKRNGPTAFAWFTAAALCKETSIVIPLTLAALSLWEAVRADSSARFKHFREAAWLAACIVPLAAWYWWHYSRTGFLFGNPEFLRYNAEANAAPLRILAAFAHRLLHLTAHMNLFVPVLLALAALLLPRRTGSEKSGLTTSAQLRIFVLLAANAAFFSVLGGALLCRYLLPMYPLVLLLAVSTLACRIRWWPALALLSAAAFVAGIFINPPYGFAPEDNLAYARMIRLHQAAIHELQSRYDGATVLSAWPATDELSKPELGYVQEPFAVFPIDDFSAPQIARAGAMPQSYSAALVFSTKIEPANPLFTLGKRSRQLDEQYFGLHHDMTPEAIARQLGGTVVWKQATSDGSLQAAILRFNRQFEAKFNALTAYNQH